MGIKGRTATADTGPSRRLRALFALADPADAERAAVRLGVEAPVPAGRVGAGPTEADLQEVRALLSDGTYLASKTPLPLSALGWMLEFDVPELSMIVLQDIRIPAGIRRDVAHGRTFGTTPGRPGARPAPTAWPGCALPKDFVLDYPRFKPADQDDRPDAPDSTGLITALRESALAGRMAPARALAAQVSGADWAPIAAADRDLPLGGYPRWALSIRPDCPEPLRAQFGSWQPRYARRMHRAGIIRDLTEYVLHETDAETALQTLTVGGWAFPDRIGSVHGPLGELVRDELGGNVEAWAVFAQLLPTFSGSLTELIVTAGAVAYSAK
jgi:hypothetical protein